MRALLTRLRFAAVLLLTLALSLGPAWAQAGKSSSKRKFNNDPYQHMSSMGRLALAIANARARQPNMGNGTNFKVSVNVGDLPGSDDEDEGICFDTDDTKCGAFNEEGEGPNATQSEVAVAVDPTGQHVVIGFNDFRGFNVSPNSVSGFMYSDDGGVTFTDGGQLPNARMGTVGTTVLPLVQGDPDVKFVPGGAGCQFIYSSIFTIGRAGTGTAPNIVYAGTIQSMGVHRSTDCGHTWQGPFEVTAASNPHGLLSGNNGRDSADKEFIDVDPETGRVLMSWTNFTSSTFIPGGNEIRVTYSDDIMTGAPPAWSAGTVINTLGATSYGGSGSMPRFAGNGSSNVYVVWYRGSTASCGDYAACVTMAFARSTDNGVTWSPAQVVTPSVWSMDHVLGNDRVHSFPGMDVDNSAGPYAGSIYIAFANNNGLDGANISLIRSTDGGLTFSAPVNLNGNPNSDRPQWFPYVAVDKNTGRVNVIYYDQGVSSSGDVTEASWVYSDDGGATWSTPAPLTPRPFHAGYGNDTGQPNLGDYVGATAQNGELFASFANTPPLVSFTDGQPTSSFNSPDVYFKRIATGPAALSLGTVTFGDSGGNGYADAGDQLKIKLPLNNRTANPLNAKTYSSINATLSTGTPGVSILRASSAYPNLVPGAGGTNLLDYVVQIAPSFTPGTKIEFSLAVTTAQGNATLLFTMDTGTPVPTTIFAENFDGVTPGALPAGWGTIHQGGTNTVPWTTAALSTLAVTGCANASALGNVLFHINANDATNPTRFERVATPNIVIPADAQYVTLDMDTCYDTEDDNTYGPNGVLAYDGMTLRITDFTPGDFARANLVEAFAESILNTQGATSFYHFNKHFPRSSSSSYFQDMSAWAGYSNGWWHVSMRLPGMAGTTVQIRPDYTQDSGGICSDIRPGHQCGVAIDNVVLQSVKLKSDELAKLTLTPLSGQVGKWTGTVTSQPIAGAGGIVVNFSNSAPAGKVTMPASVTIPQGSQTSPSFTVTLDPTYVNITVTITATGPSNVRTAGVKIVK
jgi:hypothetical protein